MTDKDDLIRGPGRDDPTGDEPLPTEGAEGLGTPREQWEDARLDAGGPLSGDPSEPSGTSAGMGVTERLKARPPAEGEPTSGA